VPRISAFPALRYRPGTDLASVSAPPYDVIAPDERLRLERSHPNNIIQITLGAERPGDGDQDNRYTRAAEILSEWRESGMLVADDAPHLYLYRSDFEVEGRLRTTAGVVAALELEELGAGGVFGHEKTRPGPKADRLALMRTTRANLEPLWFFASSTMDGFRELVEDLEGRDPIADVLDPQDVRHRVWVLSDDQGEAMTKVVNDIPLVVADGHHRYETALTYRNERREADGPGPWDSTMAIIADPVQFAPELLPIHRLVSNVTPDQVPGKTVFDGDLAALRQAVEDAGPGTVGVASRDGRWTVTTSGDVDTVWLAEQVLEPNQGEVIYEHDMRLVEDAVSNTNDTAFLMAAVPVPLVAEKALAGVRLPPKTTLFWPKPRTGLLMRDLEPGQA
jgi:uncharacterized protein (DUF1015 family)